MKAHRDVSVPVAAVNHDFVLTERYAIFLLCSLRLTPAAMLLPLGLRTIDECTTWSGQAPALVVLVPRDGGPVRMFEIEPFVSFHIAGAQEDGDELLVDLSHHPDPVWFGRTMRSYRTALWDNIYAKLTRVRLHVPSGKLLSMEPVVDFATEFPQVDVRRGLSSYRHVFTALTPKGTQGFQRGVGWVRPADKTSDIYDFGEGCVASEPVYIHKSAEASEGDGWLIAFVHDPRSEGSLVAILDALEPSRGPVYLGRVPVNAGFTFHGCWCPADA
jgi:all-trans-8'-apo-beta-carotenal 15,15'-oxygenase